MTLKAGYFGSAVTIPLEMETTSRSASLWTRKGMPIATGRSFPDSSHSNYTTVKYDTSGREIWVARYIGPRSFDWITAIAVSPQGQVYVNGRSQGDGAMNDYATIKYDLKGNELWVARYHGPGDGEDWAWRIALDEQGNVYVTGSSSGLGPRADYATVKYDPEGNELWVARYGGPSDGYDTPIALAVDGKGQVYVSGWSHGAQGAYEFATIK